MNVESIGKCYSKNMELVGYHDLNGVMAFQMALHKTEDERYYMYCGSFKGAGWTILDVTDPESPRHVKFFECCDPTVYKKQSTPKIQVANGLMVAALGGGVPFLHGCKPGDKALGGLQIYDISKDPENPELLSHWETGVEDGMGVHRFAYNGGNYVYMPAECPGFVGFIVRILDISDPRNPFECGRWWMPEQFGDGLDAGTYPTDHDGQKDWAMCHACTLSADSNLLYMGYFGGGGIILDVSDPTRPVKVSQLKVQPPFSGKFCGARCHTYLPLTGRNLAVLTNEGERFAFFNKEKLANGKHKGAQPMNNLHMIDVSDPTDPTLVAEFPYPEVPEDFPYKNFNTAGLDGAQGPFGPHNVHEPMGKEWLEDNPNRVYCCYFHAGMRVYDVSDQYYIKELAYFIPPNPKKPLFDVDIPGPMLAMTEDCVVDDRGYIYVDTFHDGVYILRCLV